MKSSRVALILCYDERVEVEKGVWEKQTIEKKVKAEKEKIYQRRLDKAMADGQVITARFLVRSNYVADNLDYVKYQGKDYKVNVGTESDDSHYTVIELGELK
ncbi:phage head closure protein [Streptococcus suis]|uniref:phage head closure protein n=1 Tax=Streptococcus suis TaxID=1307 RepID=UPI000421B36E|nr:phage head closure protein [Streptococcus suis]HEM3182542.1 phage head closure protein [Streptococcus suis 89-5259]